MVLISVSQNYRVKVFVVFFKIVLPLEEADIIALKIDEFLKEKDVIERWRIIDFPTLATVRAHEPRVAIIGYPLGFYDDVHNFPIKRSASIASPFRVGFRGEPYFLIDAILHKGISGSPVIIPRSGFRPGTKTAIHTLLGVLSAREKADLGVVWYYDLIQEIVADEMKGSIRV